MANGVRYWRRGISKVKWATAVANVASPTRAEINAAVDITSQVVEITNSYEEGRISTPDYATTFTPTLPGEATASLTLTFYDRDGTTDTVRDALTPTTNGFVLLMPVGDSPGKRMECWTARIGAGPVDIYTTGDEAAKYTVDFAALAKPQTTITIPA